MNPPPPMWIAPAISLPALVGLVAATGGPWPGLAAPAVMLGAGYALHLRDQRRPAVALLLAAGSAGPLMAVAATGSPAALPFLALPILSALALRQVGPALLIASLGAAVGLASADGSLPALLAVGLAALAVGAPRGQEEPAAAAAAPAQAPPAQAEPPRADWIEEGRLLERMGGNIALIQELTRYFDEENARQLARLREALARGEAEEVFRAAHAIKSGLSNFCAPDALDLALEVETAGRRGELAGLEPRVDRLERCLGEVAGQLGRMGSAA